MAPSMWVILFILFITMLFIVYLNLHFSKPLESTQSAQDSGLKLDNQWEW